MRPDQAPKNSVPQHPKVTWFYGCVALSMVAFYLLASARALVPGLCATQAMLDAQQCAPGSAPSSSARTASHCCNVPGPSPSDEGEKDGPATPEESHCAFCNLLIAHTEQPTFVSLPSPALPAFGEEIPLVAQRGQQAARWDAPNRAPPA